MGHNKDVVSAWEDVCDIPHRICDVLHRIWEEVHGAIYVEAPLNQVDMF